MRTTLNLDDELMRLVRRRATDTDRTITQFIEAALHDALAANAHGQPPFTFQWKTVRGRLRPGVDLSDRDSLIDRMGERP
ncbi:MAG: ribbon-helix-helix protein, CopG family [Gammaproteobacteria bacterium]